MPGLPRNAVIPLPSTPCRWLPSARRGQRLDLAVSYLAGRKHLPIVELNKAA